MVSKIKNKNWFKRHWIVSIVLGIFVIGIIGAISEGGNSTIDMESQNSNHQETKFYSIGEKIIIGDIEYTVNKAFNLPVVGSGYLSQEAKGVFLIVSLVVKNNGKNEILLSGTDFNIKDFKDREYNTDVMAGVYLDTMGFSSFTFEKLGAGLEVSGEIVFDIPRDDAGLILEINGEGFFADMVSVDLEI